MPGQLVATVAAHQQPELSEPSQQEDFTYEMGHPVHVYIRDNDNK